MFYLVMSARDFGLSCEFVRAPYASQADAEAQAAHNIERNTQKPVRIEDENGVSIRSYEG